MPDPLIRLLSGLAAADPAPRRAERTRLRCRAVLERRASRASRERPSAPPIRTAQVVQPLLAVLGAVYLTEAFIEAFRLYGRFLE